MFTITTTAELLALSSDVSWMTEGEFILRVELLSDSMIEEARFNHSARSDLMLVCKKVLEDKEWLYSKIMPSDIKANSKQAVTEADVEILVNFARKVYSRFNRVLNHA